MKNMFTVKRGIWNAIIVISGLCLVHPVYAQQGESVWGSLDVQNQASSAERVDYFQRNLRPHAPTTYTDPEYHKNIVRLNWFDNGVPMSRFVNLKRTFDIYGLFAGMSVSLTEQAKVILDDLGRAITSGGIDTRMYAIAGHSVVEGDKRADQELSTRRAKVVSDYLKKRFDIAATRLLPVGFGSHNLKDKQNVGKTENNRIEVCLIEDLYRREPTTTVQLPDTNSPEPQEIEITSNDTKAEPEERAAIESQGSTTEQQAVLEEGSLNDDPKSTKVAPNERGHVTTEIPEEHGQVTMEIPEAHGHVTTEIPEEHGQDVEVPGHYYVYEDDRYGYGYPYRPHVDLDDYSTYHWAPSPYHHW